MTSLAAVSHGSGGVAVLDSRDGPLSAMPDLSALDADQSARLGLNRERSISFYEPEDATLGSKAARKLFGSVFQLTPQLKVLSATIIESCSSKTLKEVSELLPFLDSLKEMDWLNFRSHALHVLIGHLVYLPVHELEIIHEKLALNLKMLPVKNLRELCQKSIFFQNMIEKKSISIDLLLGAPLRAYYIALEQSLQTSDWEMTASLIADTESTHILPFLETYFESRLVDLEASKKFLEAMTKIAGSLGRNYQMAGYQKILLEWIEKVSGY